MLWFLCVCVILAEGEKLENKLKRLEMNYAPLQVVPVVEKMGTQEVKQS